MPVILTINAGSSSIKYQCFDMDSEECLAKGHVDRLLSSSAKLFYTRRDGVTHRVPVPQTAHETVFQRIFEILLHPEKGILRTPDEIHAVGHRVVHGGSHFSASTRITPEVEKIIEQCAPLAPLHNPFNLRGIRACQTILPDIPHIAVFDTAFHQTIPDYAHTYALPYTISEQYQIRQYGFHGISHQYVAMRAAQILDSPLKALKLITCHLGNGCSITAIANGKSIDTSMGFTPLQGLVMGTRSGDIDPAIIFYLIREHQMTPDQIDQMLNHQSGLIGVSGIGSDLRDLIAVYRENRRAALAIDIFCYRIRQYIGKYAAVLDGIDALVFTAGIGENAPLIRTRICEKLGFLGIHLDQAKNEGNPMNEAIHHETAPVSVLVIPTNEELMIARDTLHVIRAEGKD